MREVQNYWNATLRVEEWAAQKLPLTEELIRRLHALVERGPRPSPPLTAVGRTSFAKLLPGLSFTCHPKPLMCRG